MLGQSSNHIYLHVISGRIHQRVPSSTEKAVERTLKDGKVVHELIYTFVEGLLSNIELNEGDYGKQWIFHIEDGKESYALQVSEASGYGDDLLTKIPALEKNNTYRFIPYEYTKKDKKRTGVKIQKGDDIITSCYHKFTQEQDGWKVETTDPNYPKPEKDKMDSEEWKIYFMRVRKYLREKALGYLSSWDGFKPEPVLEQADDDLPF